MHTTASRRITAALTVFGTVLGVIGAPRTVRAQLQVLVAGANRLDLTEGSDIVAQFFVKNLSPDALTLTCD